eukprot:Plantae.Rhodophyta-Purpureofilum_apyrenoidigerum.ctg2197.p1 GENE.Plantae.Rhodophyta-Purpureofilum_apyrenoidigerum.ctg2197~~Plantae.Rhodophyta-Purpureofilum_apyrenoidigerum.ctg2197.p1  ORF type:complete len:184 (-),score=39.95 Plantae.Rhodophyta-Purpureofilum_apyrenoidigerum.ctg2197:212-763(-)
MQFEDQEYMPLSGQELIDGVSEALETACNEPFDMDRTTLYRGFFGTHVLTFSMRSYLRRLMERLNCSNSAFITALIYLDRLMVVNPCNRVTPLNVHRLYTTALLLAVKYHDDLVYSQSYYAECFGMQGTEEINTLEAHLLDMLSFRLSVSEKEYETYKFYLQKIDLVVKDIINNSSMPIVNAA